jgi:hypothetical protein
MRFCFQINTDKGSRMKTNENQFVELQYEIRSALPTTDAAFHLNRRPQTLRTWACFENGPIRPIRINGRLAWLVSDIKKIMGDERC